MCWVLVAVLPNFVCLRIYQPSLIHSNQISITVKLRKYTTLKGLNKSIEVPRRSEIGLFTLSVQKIIIYLLQGIFKACLSWTSSFQRHTITLLNVAFILFVKLIELAGLSPDVVIEQTLMCLVKSLRKHHS